MSKDIYIQGFGLVNSATHGINMLAEFTGNKNNVEEPKPSLKNLLPGAKLRRIPSAALMALEAAALALKDASLPTRFTDAMAPSAGIFIGSGHCCIEASFSFMNSIVDFGAKLSSPTAFSLSVNNVFTGLLSLHLNAQGPSYTSCQFGASFAGALTAACSSLMSGGCQFALVGAVEEQNRLLDEVYKIGLKSNEAKKRMWEMPASDCAVFFVLSIVPGEDTIKIHAPVWQKQARPKADMYFSLQNETGLSAPILDCLALYGAGPALQACDLAMAYALLREGVLPASNWLINPAGNMPYILPKSIVCECFSDLTQIYSALHICRG